MWNSDQQLATQEAAKCLVEGSTKSHAQRNDVVRMVAHDIPKICQAPKRLHFNATAEIMVNKYVQFSDECDMCFAICG
jgi:hypothetical protein